MEENVKQSVTPGILRIAVIGPECTGKTTLSRSLAEHFGTRWVPEFAREFLQDKWDRTRTICEPADMIPILRGQISAENEAAASANRILICDTCALQSKVYSDIYYGSSEASLEKAARKHRYDLFFLTDVDVPWEHDDLRDRPNDRENIFGIFRDALQQYDKPYVVLSGDAGARKRRAIELIDGLFRAKEMGFTSNDFLQILDQGIFFDDIEKQLGFFKKGIAKADLDRPATVGDGISRLSAEEFERRALRFESAIKGKTVEKFVPASGAASRMFKFLTEFINEFDAQNESINAYINRKNATDLRIFLAGLEKFPFYPKVWKKLKSVYPDFDSWDRATKVYHFIRFMLEPKYFNLCGRPKGVLPFHKYKGHVASPVEEHLYESVSYASDGELARVHFTVSEEHQTMFEDIISRAKPKVESESGIKIRVSFSYQDKSTDTIAVGTDNVPFRDKDGKLVFRPGGHGALIKNLHERDSDIIFIKNIDNVIQNHKDEIALYKKALGELLMELQEEIHSCLRKLENQSITEGDLERIRKFSLERLNLEFDDDFDKYTINHKIDYVKQMLYRPIRVCGIVKNEGEPGGGPFWVRDKKGIPRLQIVESSQVDLANPAQASLMKSATHFNPVDIVCSIKDHNGKKFNLPEFVDHNSGFIVDKNKDGRPLKGYELPGLWNGAMGKWITVFVEVPLVTFNPVKTVNDLLKASHQEYGQG